MKILLKRRGHYYPRSIYRTLCTCANAYQRVPMLLTLGVVNVAIFGLVYLFLAKQIYNFNHMNTLHNGDQIINHVDSSNTTNMTKWERENMIVSNVTTIFKTSLQEKMGQQHHLQDPDTTQQHHLHDPDTNKQHHLQDPDTSQQQYLLHPNTSQQQHLQHPNASQQQRLQHLDTDQQHHLQHPNASKQQHLHHPNTSHHHKQQHPKISHVDDLAGEKSVFLDCGTVLASSDVNFSTDKDFKYVLTSPADSGGINRTEQRDVNDQQHTSINNASSRWCGRSFQSSYKSETSFKLLSQWLSSGGINIISLFRQSIISCSFECSQKTYAKVNNQSIFLRILKQELRPEPNISSRLSQLEADILKLVAPTTDVNLISNVETSQVRFLNSVDNLNTGDSVLLRVDLYDGYGNAKREGGDELRVWISDSSVGNGNNGLVADLNNGSYLINLTVKWPGEQNVNVALHHPREIIRTMIFLRHVMGTMRYLTSAFENGSYGEVTPCMWYPVIPGYDDICDLTSLNGGLPWFCGKPFSHNLTCEDWTRAQAADFVNPLPITRGEKIWIDKMNREPYIRTIPFNNSLLTVTGANFQGSQTPCWQIPHENTWMQYQPTGWFFKHKWHATECDSKKLMIDFERNWLQNKSLYFLGDSNMKEMFKLARRDFCTMNSLKELPFPGPMNCSDPQFGIKVFFRAHAHPFNLPHPDHFRKFNKPLSAWLDKIGDTEDVLAVCHLYLHFSQFSLPLYVLHVKDLIRGVQRLLNRNPRARVAIRGTHVIYKGWPIHAAGGDVFAFEFNQILKREFSPLYDKVMYLDGWDMSVAAVNLNFHPERYVAKALMNQIFNHFIGRKQLLQ